MIKYYKLAFNHGYQKALIRLIKYHFNRGNTQVAIHLCNIGIKMNYYECYRQLGLIYLDNNDEKNALKMLNIAAYHGNSNAMLDIGLIMKETNYKQGVKFLTNSIMNNNIKAYIYMAELMEDQKDYKGAEERYKQAYKIDPTNKKLLLSMGNFYKNRDNYGLALKYFTESTSIDGYIRIGSICKDVFKDDNKALEYFQKAYNIDPNSKMAAHFLGHYYENIKDYQKMIYYYEIADDELSLLNLGIYYKKLNDSKCIDYLLRVIECHANILNKENAAIILGNFYRKNKNYSEMLKYYEIAAINSNKKANRLIGLYYKSINNNEMALKYFIIADEYFEIGNYFKNINNYEDAIMYYTKARDLSFTVEYELGFCYEQIGNKSMMEKYYSLSFDPRSKMNLAFHYLKTKKFKEGIVHLENILNSKTLPDDINKIKYELGKFYQMNKDYNKMAHYFEQILENYPDVVRILLSYCIGENKNIYDLSKDIFYKDSLLLQYMKKHNMMYEIAELYKNNDNIVMAILYYNSGHELKDKRCTEILIQHYENAHDYSKAMKLIDTL